MQWLELGAADFAARFADIVDNRRETDSDVSVAVREIIADVQQRGDAALADYSLKFDAVDLRTLDVRVSDAQVQAAIARCDPKALAALDVAAKRIAWFHQQQKPSDLAVTDDIGVHMGYRYTPMDAVGLYVPGGLAAYPSSVLMNAIPARVAGVPRIVMVSPTPKGEVRDLVLAAAHLAGITEIYRIGGAQAIAALAYGTGTIQPVDKITGPGNAYVAEAKRQVFGRVGIDMIAGPSEILVIADAHNNPDWIAADLLSQAEHDPSAQAILITDDVDFGRAVEAAVARALPTLSTEKTARRAWTEFGVIIIVRNLRAEVPALANALAGEHLELCVDDPRALMADIRHAGSIFCGRHTPEAIGDYLGGPNHVLPTGRRARFASGLGVADFMKRTTYLETSPAAFAKIADSAATLAEFEGLPAHALSVRVRNTDAR
jgi:histidinol dehydrogenase